MKHIKRCCEPLMRHKLSKGLIRTWFTRQMVFDLSRMLQHFTHRQTVLHIQGAQSVCLNDKIRDRKAFLFLNEIQLFEKEYLVTFAIAGSISVALLLKQGLTGKQFPFQENSLPSIWYLWHRHRTVYIWSVDHDCFDDDPDIISSEAEVSKDQRWFAVNNTGLTKFLYIVIITHRSKVISHVLIRFCGLNSALWQARWLYQCQADEKWHDRAEKCQGTLEDYHLHNGRSSKLAIWQA